MSLSNFTASPLLHDEAQKLIDTLRSALIERCHPDRIILFGSAARGEMTTHSDLDICLLFIDKVTLKAGRDGYYREKPPIDTPCDIIFLTHDEFDLRSARGGVCQLIKSEGKILYEKEKT